MKWFRIAASTAAVCVALVAMAAVFPAASFAENPALTVTVTNDTPDGAAEFGSSVTFTYTVRNSGDEAVTGIAVDDGWAGHLGDIATLEPGEVSTFTRVIVVEGSIGGPGTCTAVGTSASQATVSATGTYFLDVFIADDFTDFSIEKRLVSGKAVQGGRLVYRLTVRNVQGTEPDPDAATLSVVDDFDQSRARVVDAAGGTISLGTIVWQVPAPGPGDGPVVIEYEMQVAADATGRLVNTASIANPLDPVSDNDSDSVALGITRSSSGAGSASTGEDDPAPAGGSTAASGSSASSDEPFLPFTGAPLLPTLPIAAGFALLGAALRRYGR